MTTEYGITTLRTTSEYACDYRVSPPSIRQSAYNIIRSLVLGHVYSTSHADNSFHHQFSRYFAKATLVIGVRKEIGKKWILHNAM